MGKNKSLLIGVAVVAVAVIVYFAFFHPPTSREDMEGTIGTVEKYRAEQIKPEKPADYVPVPRKIPPMTQ